MPSIITNEIGATFIPFSSEDGQQTENSIDGYDHYQSSSPKPTGAALTIGNATQLALRLATSAVTDLVGGEESKTGSSKNSSLTNIPKLVSAIRKAARGTATDSGFYLEADMLSSSASKNGSEDGNGIVSTVTKMISHWTTQKSKVPGDEVDLGISSESLSTFEYGPSPNDGVDSGGELYLKRNRLTRFGASWLNDSVVRELPPQSLPLIGSGDSGVERLFGANNIDFNDTFGDGLGNCSWTYDNIYNCTNTTTTDLVDSLGYNYWSLLLIVFSVFAVFGNVLVILSVKRERSLWNVTNYFIVSLAVADLLVAGVVMPFGVYFLFNRTKWHLPPIACDFYIAMDVTCSTSSILNLVAISIDRFIAVTQPIKYAKHKSNTRVWLTIVFVWVFSGLVGSPIVLGLNTPLEDVEVDVTLCTFHNYYFVFFSSLCSFYIPCTILVYLYYRIFKVIRERAKKAAGGHGKPVGGTVIENLAQTKRLAETTLGGGPSTLPIPSSQPDDEKCTNTGSGSQEEGDDLDMDKDLEDGEGDDDQEGEGDASPDSDDCQIIANNRVATAFVLESVRNEERGTLSRMEQNGNHDSGYAASNMEEGPHPVAQEPSLASPKLSLAPLEPYKRNGLKDEADKKSSGGESATSSKKAAASRFTICKAHKASRRKKEKSSAKRERKATKTLAIVLGLFLLCWLPFFTCNIMDAICSMTKQECGPGLTTFLLTTWLGYANSCLNPIIYTIFNPEFRKAFKKIMGLGG